MMRGGFAWMTWISTMQRCTHLRLGRAGGHTHSCGEGDGLSCFDGEPGADSSGKAHRASAGASRSQRPRPDRRGKEYLRSCRRALQTLHHGTGRFGRPPQDRKPARAAEGSLSRDPWRATLSRPDPGAEARSSLAGARPLLQGLLRVCATTRAILLPKMTLATCAPKPSLP
jgi:hypothetical protein